MTKTIELTKPQAELLIEALTDASRHLFENIDDFAHYTPEDRRAIHEKARQWRALVDEIRKTFPLQCACCGAEEGKPHHDPPAGWPKRRKVKLVWVMPRHHLRTPLRLECQPCKQGGDEIEADRVKEARAGLIPESDWK